jgi:hypothetical protein
MMSEQATSRRQFLRQSAIATSAVALVGRSLDEQASAHAAEVDRSITVQKPPAVRQIDVLFDSANYTAFPHVVRLDGDELLMAFRQAPAQKQVRHTHPRSVITVIRSYDLGETWDIENAGQLAAGGGQEFAPIYLGDGVVGGLLAMHEVVPVKESKRTGVPHIHKHEYPFRNVGGFWCWSDNSGLTWPLQQHVLFAPRLQTCSTAIKLGAGILLAPCYGSHEREITGVSSNVLYRSDDNGQTWSTPTVMAKGTKTTRDYYEPVVLELQDGHLLAMHRVGRCQDGRNGLFWQNESRDGGKTWTEPFGILLTYGRRYEPFGLYARLSTDEGKTWSDTSWLLRAAPNSNQGYSSSVEINPGQVFTVCYEQNKDGVTGITGTFWSVPSS